MLALVLSLAAFQADDVLLPPGRWEGRITESSSEWQRLKAGREAGTADQWTELRTDLTLDGPPENGMWTLVAGPPGVAIEASLNDRPLEPIADPQADPTATTGAAFRVPHQQLQDGDNPLTLHFPEGGALRCVEEGPTYLLSPRLARYYREHLETRTSVTAANPATRVHSSPQGHMATRIQFKDGDDGRFRTTAMLDLRLVDRQRELDVCSLSAVEVMGDYPLSSVQAKDPSFPGMEMMQRCFAPFSPERPEESFQALLLGEVSNKRTDQSFEHVYHLRLFPCRGGPLKARVREGLVILGNDAVSLFATNAEILGTNEQPTGLAITLQQTVTPGGGPGSLMGPRELWGVLEPTAEDRERPRQFLRRMLDLTDGYNGLQAKTANWANGVLFVPPDQWSRGAVFPTESSRRLAQHTVQTLNDSLRRETFLADPRLHYWSSLLLQLHLPDEERRFLQELMDRPFEDPVGAVYACLRATRFLHWQEDEELATRWLPNLQEWLQQARSVAANAPTSLLVARIAAGSSVAELLRQQSQGEAATSLEATLQEDRDRLLSPVQEGGRWQGDHLAPGSGEDPMQLAECLALPILPDTIREPEALHLEQVLTGPAQLGSLDHHLQILALLSTGRVELALPRLQEMVQALEDPGPLPSASGALYGVVVHGLLGARKPAPGVLEVRPLLEHRGLLRLSLPIGKGMLAVHMDRPDRSFFRKIAVTNTTGGTLRVIYGVPGGLGTGPRIKQGDVSLSLYECSVDHGERHKDEVR